MPKKPQQSKNPTQTAQNKRRNPRDTLQRATFSASLWKKEQFASIFLFFPHRISKSKQSMLPALSLQSVHTQRFATLFEFFSLFRRNFSHPKSFSPKMSKFSKKRKKIQLFSIFRGTNPCKMWHVFVK
ncbi:MAG: hypothetical protein Q4D38_01940 [Planctomycetia bacterium]|nr:hypothetical protein [Planctomycetia bacterium]